MSRKIQTQAQITGVRALSDRSISLNIHTQEMSDIEKTVLFGFQGKTGWLLFKEDEVQDHDIPKQDTDISTKSPSQRLRGVLFVLFSQSGSTGDFRDFYEKELEKIINHYKNKLE